MSAATGRDARGRPGGRPHAVAQRLWSRPRLAPYRTSPSATITSKPTKVLMALPPFAVTVPSRNVGSRRAVPKRATPRVLAAMLALLLAPAAGAAGGADLGAGIVLHVDADPVDYCLYDGRPYSEGAYIETPGGLLVCTYRERAAGSGETYVPADDNRRLKWLRQPADTD